MAKTPSPPWQSRSNSPNKQQKQTDSTKTDINNDLQLTFLQPWCLTSEILQQFLNINHRYCHKIKVSIPWKDEQNIPNLDTYHKSIHYFFAMIKHYDPQFQILPWDISQNQCNPISEDINIPETHDELLSFLCNHLKDGWIHNESQAVFFGSWDWYLSPRIDQDRFLGPRTHFSILGPIF
jgi:hypothetical protein